MFACCFAYYLFIDRGVSLYLSALKPRIKSNQLISKTMIIIPNEIPKPRIPCRRYHRHSRNTRRYLRRVLYHAKGSGVRKQDHMEHSLCGSGTASGTYSETYTCTLKVPCLFHGDTCNSSLQ